MTAVNATAMRRLARLARGWLPATFQHTSVRKYEQQFLNYWVRSEWTDVWPIQDIISAAVIFNCRLSVGIIIRMYCTRCHLEICLATNSARTKANEKGHQTECF